MSKSTKIFIWSSSAAVFTIALVFFGMPILEYIQMKKCARFCKEEYPEILNESIEYHKNSIRSYEESKEEAYAKLKEAEDLNNDFLIKLYKEQIEWDISWIEDHKEGIQRDEETLKYCKVVEKIADVYFKNWGFLMYWHCNWHQFRNQQNVNKQQENVSEKSKNTQCLGNDNSFVLKQMNDSSSVTPLSKCIDESDYNVSEYFSGCQFTF